MAAIEQNIVDGGTEIEVNDRLGLLEQLVQSDLDPEQRYHLEELRRSLT